MLESAALYFFVLPGFHVFHRDLFRAAPIRAVDGLKVSVLVSPVTARGWSQPDWPGVSTHVPLFLRRAGAVLWSVSASNNL